MSFNPDPSQQAALSATGPLLVLGPPGSGKTQVALETVRLALADGMPASRIVVVTATRRAAAKLRTDLGRSAPVTTSTPLVRTAPSLAFGVLRTRAALLGQVAPTLISGAEQDAILAELLSGHEDPSVPQPPWPTWLSPETLRLRAFRDELRDLLMRAAERGVSPEQLHELGVAADRQEWVAAARLYEEYLDTTALRSTVLDVGDRFDPAVIVAEAAHVLINWDNELSTHDRPSWDLVVVDDYHEATAATVRLLNVLALGGARVVLLADPDLATQVYRGAVPWVVQRAGHPSSDPNSYDGLGAFGAQVVHLDRVWRHGPTIRALAPAIAVGIPAIAGGQRRRVAAREEGDPGSVSAAILGSPTQQVTYLAGLLRRAYLYDGVPWSQMAVLTRTNTAAAELRADLAAADVPVAASGGTGPLNREPVARALLTALAVADEPNRLDGETATQLALSALGGMDATGLRRIRRLLRAQEIAAGGDRAAGVLLVEAMSDPKVTAQTSHTGPLQRLAKILAAGRGALGRPAKTPDAGGAETSGDLVGRQDATPSSVGQVADALWAIWDSADLAENWRQAALAGDQQADHDLDVVMRLFEAVEQYEDRTVAATVAGFIDLLDRQEFATDTLAATGHHPETVTVTTVAGAAGQEWDLVVVTELQDGVWPDLRIRDSVLGASALAEVIAAREQPRPASDSSRDWFTARQAVLADELRLLHVACTRARNRLVLTAVADSDNQYSPFLDLVVPADLDLDTDSRRVDVLTGVDFRSVVAAARAHVEAGVGSDADDAAVALGEQSAQLLAYLAAEGVAGADPATWQAAPIPTGGGLLVAGEKLHLSPSKLEAAVQCPLRYVLTAAGGEGETTGAQSLGTIIHEIAERHPTGERDAMLAALDGMWDKLELGNGWAARRQREDADQVVAKLAQKLQERPAPLATEYGFRVELPEVVLTGKIDRIEPVQDRPKAVKVVDLKTGKKPVKEVEVEQHPQLGAYQVAVDSGALDEILPDAVSGGAELLYVRLNLRNPRDQAELADGTWAMEMIAQVLEDLSGSEVVARPGEYCEYCPVRSSCPVCVDGTRVRS
jgi:superfamily I DNA/RNA helicase/RecB family exonuclease